MLAAAASCRQAISRVGPSCSASRMARKLSPGTQKAASIPLARRWSTTTCPPLRSRMPRTIAGPRRRAGLWMARRTLPAGRPPSRVGARRRRVGWRVAPRRRNLVADQLAVGDAVGAGGLGAEAPDLVGLVVGEVALEPGDPAVALEGEHVGGDPVQEPAVVADHDRAAGEVEQRAL